MWLDPDPLAAGDPAQNHAYLLHSVSPCGEGTDSRRVGTFTFDVTPGS